MSAGDHGKRPLHLRGRIEPTRLRRTSEQHCDLQGGEQLEESEQVWTSELDVLAGSCVDALVGVVPQVPRDNVPHDQVGAGNAGLVDESPECGGRRIVIIERNELAALLLGRERAGCFEQDKDACRRSTIERIEERDVTVAVGVLQLPRERGQCSDVRRVEHQPARSANRFIPHASRCIVHVIPLRRRLDARESEGLRDQPVRTHARGEVVRDRQQDDLLGGELLGDRFEARADLLRIADRRL